MSDLIYYRMFSSKSNQLFALFGFILIIVSIGFFDDRYIPPFPNLYTLIPTCGTALIILFGQKTTFIGYLLSRHVLQWIGLISYSAYLWHQPLFAFMRLQSYQIREFSTILTLVTIIFLLSIFSYLFIERPFRNKKNFSQTKIFSMAGVAALLILIIGLSLIITAHHRTLSFNNMNDTYLFDLQNYYNYEYTKRNYDAHASKENNCSNTRSPSNRRLVLIGDSFAQDFYNMMIEGNYLMDYEICLYMILHECGVYIGSVDREQFIDGAVKQRCTNAYDIKYALPMIRLANLIILSGYWLEWNAERLSTTIKLLNLTKSQQIFVTGHKSFGVVTPQIYIDKSHEYRIKQYQYANERVLKMNDILEKTIDKSIFVNIHKMICKGINGTCPLFTPNGKLISYDGVHLTKYGALYVGHIIFDNKPLNRLK